MFAVFPTKSVQILHCQDVGDKGCREDGFRYVPCGSQGRKTLLDSKLELKTELALLSHLGRVLLGSTNFGWLSCLSFFVFYWKKTFLVGPVEQPFQPSQRKVEIVGIDGQRPLTSWAHSLRYSRHFVLSPPISKETGDVYTQG